MTALVLLALATAAAPPLSLDDALGEASRRSPELALARAHAAEAGVERFASYAGVLPRLDVTARFGHNFAGERTLVTAFPTSIDPVTGQPVFEQSAVAIPATDSADYSVEATAQLLLFDGGRNWRTIERARVLERAAGRNVDEASLAVSFDVTLRFYEAIKAQESLRVLEEAAARSEELLRRSEALFEAGRAGRLDVLAARGNLGTDRIAVERARARLDQARAELARSIGHESSGELVLKTPEWLQGPLTASEEPPTEVALLARARADRPLLASHRENVRASQLGESIAAGAWFPSVSGKAGYTRQGPNLSGQSGVYGPLARQYTATAQLVASWNLFDGRQTLASVERAAVATRVAHAEADRASQQVAAEIARARASVVALARAARVAAENVGAAEQGVAVARDRLEAGAASQLEVRDASLKLTEGRLSLLEARIDEVVARADLNRAVGGSL